MKHLRLALLLLLVVLLPIRGAVAAALMCPPAVAPQVPSGITAPHDHSATAGAGHAGMGHAHSHEAHAEGSAGGHTHGAAVGAQDKCNLCAASCFVTPLLSDMPQAPQPLLPAARPQPDLDAPAPSFLSGGPERPPRSI